MQTALEQHEIERAKHAHEKLEIQLDLDDELEGLDIMRLSRGVDAQEAVLEARFECISDVTALLFASVGEHAEIKPGSPYYNKLIILQGLIDDQIVAFHFIMKRETEEKARVGLINDATIRSRMLKCL